MSIISSSGLESSALAHSSTFDSVLSTKKVPCYFDPSTCQRQSFSIPEKIVYYIAKNATNGETFKKLVEACKYFFKVNPVIVVPQIKCFYDTWNACYDEDEEYRVGIKYGQQINGKIWVTHRFSSFSCNASKLIPSIYKNDAPVVNLRGEPLKLKDFLFLAGNAADLSMSNRLVYENGKTVQLEDIGKDLPKLKSLTFRQDFDGNDVNCNTVRKLMETEHFKQLSYLMLSNISEVLDVVEMFEYICENKHITVDLCYREEISDAFKELVKQYSNLLQKQIGCNSRIRFNRMEYVTFAEFLAPASEDNSSDISSDNDDNDNSFSDVYENEEDEEGEDEDEEWEHPSDQE